VKSGSEDTKVLAYVDRLEPSLKELGIRVHVDRRDTISAGRKFNEWEVKGVPVRLEIGQKEMSDESVTLVFRDTGEKMTIPIRKFVSDVETFLSDMQKRLFEKQKAFLGKNTYQVDSWDEFVTIMGTKKGFLQSLWCEDAQCEKQIKEKTKATTRCLPLDSREEKGVCVHCGKPATHRWTFGQSY
jgi:prolyl-tRNA synthetase